MTPSPSVKITSLPHSLLRFPPDPRPEALPPPSDNPAFAHPFSISPNVYNALLDINVPITIALLYMTTVTYLNRYNAQCNHKPWFISKTKAFFIFVIAHNVLLAVYSAWTCLGMINAVSLSFPGWRGPYGLAGVVDSFCKINGPRGLGAAATYNPNTGSWGIADKTMRLAADGLAPDSTDTGRIWNGGLAFYGWLFYLSKFYEVLDTFIILAKGKKSSFLQTYHHAGAMLCMWAGIRYMAPPIWMFVLVNSGLHALMYTYYTLTALSVKVPTRAKKVLTTLQIAQFIIGASFAFAHLFLAYTIPVSVPYTFSLADLTTIASAITADASSAASIATATASAAFPSWLKKLAFRAAGREGLAENVVNEQGETFGVDAIRAAEDMRAREEIRYRNELHWVHCTDTSGQAFAILLNCMYLAPLTFLFVKFFIRAYSKRLERRRSSTTYNIEQSAKDAFHGVAREAVDAIGDMHGSGDGETISTEEVIEFSEETTKEEARLVRESLLNGLWSAEQSTNQEIESAQEKGNEAIEPAQEKGNEAVESAQEQGNEAEEPAREQENEAEESTREQGNEAVESAQGKGYEMVESVQEKEYEVVESAQEKGNEAEESAREQGNEAEESAQKQGNEAEESAQKQGDEAEESAQKQGDEVEEPAQEQGDEAEEPAQEQGNEAEESAQEQGNEAEESAREQGNEAEESAQEQENEMIESTQEQGKGAEDSVEESPEQASESGKETAEEGKESAEQSSVSEAAVSTEPMSEDGGLADDTTELHETGLQ